MQQKSIAYSENTNQNFDLEDDRRALIACRVRDGADTPDGHTYSNILELRENWEKSRPGDFCQQHIPRLMRVQEKRLLARAAGG